MRVEALLSGFPKLLSPAKLQQQYIDAEHVRYLFQPMETLFILLITTKNSNIVEDLDTLRLLAKVVVDACGTSEFFRFYARKTNFFPEQDISRWQH